MELRDREPRMQNKRSTMRVLLNLNYANANQLNSKLPAKNTTKQKKFNNNRNIIKIKLH